MLLDDVFSSSGSGVAQLFKVFFESVYSTSSLNISDSLDKSKKHADICHQPNINFTACEIFEALSSLDSNSCPGPDGIPNLLLRSYKYSLSIPICRLLIDL